MPFLRLVRIVLTSPLLVLGSIDWAAAVLSILAIVTLFRRKPGMATVLGGAELLGLLLRLIGVA